MENLLSTAVGNGIGRKIADKLLAEADFIEEMVQVARDGLKAETAICTKGGGIEMVPDQKTRQNMFFGLLEQFDGKPVERILTQAFGQPGGPGEDLDAQLNDSPAFRSALRRKLDKADRRAAKAEKQAERVPIEVGDPAPTEGPAGSF